MTNDKSYIQEIIAQVQAQASTSATWHLSAMPYVRRTKDVLSH